VTPTLLLALYAQRWLVAGLSLGAVKGLTMAQIEMRNLCKSFKDDTVLKDVSLNVEKGEIVALFGPSGTGKTVLLRLLAGVYAPDGGTIGLRGRDAAGTPPEKRGMEWHSRTSRCFAYDGAGQYRKRADGAEGERGRDCAQGRCGGAIAQDQPCARACAPRASQRSETTNGAGARFGRGP